MGSSEFLSELRLIWLRLGFVKFCIYQCKMESRASASRVAEVALLFLVSTFVLGFVCALVQNCWQAESELVQLYVNPSFFVFLTIWITVDNFMVLVVII